MFPESYPIYTRVRTLTLTNAAAAIKATPGRLHALHITNRHSAAIFVKLYDASVAGTTVGTTAPVNIFQVAANSQVVHRFTEAPIAFGTAITAACTTGVTDADATAAATLPIIEAEIA